MQVTVLTVRNDVEYAEALARMKEIWNSRNDADLAEMDILAGLVDRFERNRFAALPIPVDILNTMIDDGERTRAELVELIGENRASEVLNRKRALNLDMIRKVSQAWSLPIELLTPAYKLDETARKSYVRGTFNIDE